jgi:hypothetical protein
MWAAVLALPAIAAVSFGFYLVFAAPIPDPPASPAGPEAAAQELAIARMETQARRNALATTGGLAALLALAVTIRRQLHHEHATRDAQAAELRRQAHLEEDALQRRITDARIRAVEQLGSDNPAVRTGGLHNLERIGQLHPELRQVVLDEVCAYLRRSYTPPAAAGTISRRQFEPLDPLPAPPGDDEGDVRRTAQEVLQRHLRPVDGNQYWEHTRLNLRGAHLDDLDLAHCRLGRVDFRGAAFTGETDFWQARFMDEADFSNATFAGDTYSSNARFGGYTSFRYATFSGRAHFSESLFTNSAVFMGTTFTSQVRFSGAILNAAYFTGATFAADVYFGAVTTSEDEGVKDAAFIEVGDFTDTRFLGRLLPSAEMAALLRDQGVEYTAF